MYLKYLGCLEYAVSLYKDTSRIIDISSERVGKHLDLSMSRRGVHTSWMNKEYVE